MNNKTILAIVVLALCFGTSCRHDDPKKADPIDPTGDWSMQYTKTSDTCGVDWPDEIIDVQLRLSPDRTFLIWQDEGRPCDNTAGHRWDDSGVGGGTEIDEFQGNDGCTYRDTIDVSAVFTNDRYDSELVTTRTVVAGSNCTNFPTPCEVRESVVGTRCSGCWNGCT